MHPIGPDLPTSQAADTKHVRTDPARVRDAARQFESLLLAQILKSMRESSSAGWLGSGDDQAGATAVGMAEEQFAEAISRRGGLGIADLIAAGLQDKR